MTRPAHLNTRQAIPAGLGDDKANIQLKTDKGAVALKDANSPFKATGQQGVYQHAKTGETLRISSQGVFGDTWLTGKLSDNGGALGKVANWANNDWAQVGRRTYIERFNPQGQMTSADFFRADDHGNIIESDSLKPQSAQKPLSQDQISQFRQQTEDGIDTARFKNTHNAVMVPLGIIGALAALLFGGAYAVGAGTTAAATGSVANAGAAGTAAMVTVGNALAKLVTTQMGRIVPLVIKMKVLLSQSPKLFSMLASAVKNLGGKIGMPALKMPKFSTFFNWLNGLGSGLTIWDNTKGLIKQAGRSGKNLVKGAWQRLASRKP
jgi:hypothetical protein